MRAHKSISNSILASNMRPINVTLDSVTWELAKQKPNFSEWVRNQLRSERNKTEVITRRCVYCYGVFEAGPTFYDHKCITLDKGWDGEEE